VTLLAFETVQKRLATSPQPKATLKQTGQEKPETNRLKDETIKYKLTVKYSIALVKF